MSRTTISAAALTGTPRTLPSPRKSQASLSTELVAKTVAKRSFSRLTLARRMISVTSVVRNGRALR